MDYSLDSFQGLYKDYSGDLEQTRKRQIEFYNSQGYLTEVDDTFIHRALGQIKKAWYQVAKGGLMRPQLDDIEAELSYLLMRHWKPETVVEISPCGGWSSTWLLRALHDNGGGKLHSYDLINKSTKFVPENLAAGVWNFKQGDVTKNMTELPAKIDYLFIDSDHSSRFAHWYIDNLFPKLEPGTPVSVHDVFHYANPGEFDGEGQVIIDWLAKKEIPYITFAPAAAQENYAAIMDTKQSLGMGKRIHRSKANSMIFFHI